MHRYQYSDLAQHPAVRSSNIRVKFRGKVATAEIRFDLSGGNEAECADRSYSISSLSHVVFRTVSLLNVRIEFGAGI